MSKKSRAVIWDMDGVIADTAPYHFKAWQNIFRKYGVEYTRDAFNNDFGRRNDSIIRGVLGDNTPEERIKAIAQEKETRFRQAAAGNIAALPGVIKLIEALHAGDFLQALGSSAPEDNIRLIIRETGIGKCLQTIVAGTDVKEGKPSPQGFLLAAERLMVSPQDCVVIEDAVAGVAAAKNGGMKCLAVTNTNPASKLAQADMIVDSLEKVTVSDFIKLINH